MTPVTLSGRVSHTTTRRAGLVSVGGPQWFLSVCRRDTMETGRSECPTECGWDGPSHNSDGRVSTPLAQCLVEVEFVGTTETHPGL